MPQPLVDLLWRAHPDAPGGGTRGPRAKHSIADMVECAVALADRSGLGSVTVRALADSLGISTMSVYTHVNSRDDLLVLMVDTVHDGMARPGFGRSGWRTRIRRVAEANLALVSTHRWLLQVRDPRIALGPGTIAKYDYELRAFDNTHLDDLSRDAALTFLLDFVGSSASSLFAMAGDFGPEWIQAAARLGTYLGDDYSLAQRIGQVAGESMGAPYSAERAWNFGLERVIGGLAEIIDTTPN